MEVNTKQGRGVAKVLFFPILTITPYFFSATSKIKKNDLKLVISLHIHKHIFKTLTKT